MLPKSLVRYMLFVRGPGPLTQPSKLAAPKIESNLKSFRVSGSRVQATQPRSFSRSGWGSYRVQHCGRSPNFQVCVGKTCTVGLPSQRGIEHDCAGD